MLQLKRLYMHLIYQENGGSEKSSDLSEVKWVHGQVLA